MGVDVEAFVRDGFVVVRGAIEPEVVEACRSAIVDSLLSDQGVDCDEPATWRPHVSVSCPSGPAFDAAASSAELVDAYDALIGPGRWTVPAGLGGSVPARFPSEEYPGSVGWHIDGNRWNGEEYLVDVRSTGRGLLALSLFSDVGPDDAPTRLLAGSHHFIAAAFAPLDDGDVRSDDLIDRLQPSVFCRTVAHATGHAGDVWLCHPFLVHTATWPHRGHGARLMVQGTVICEDGFAIDGSDPAPVARGIADRLHETA